VAIVVSGLGLVLAAPLLVVWSAHPLPAWWSEAYVPFHHLLRPSMHTNAMAANLALLLPLGLAFLLYAWGQLGWVARGLLVASVVGMSVLFTRCDSHGATLALWAALLLLVFLRWSRAWKGFSAAVLGGLLGCAIGAAVFDLYPALQALLLDDAALSLEGRLEVWSRAIYMIQDFPFTGIGLGSFRQVADALYPLFLAPPGTTPHAHNLFLQIAVDLGLPGLIAWLAVLGVSLFAALQVYRRGCQAHDRRLAALGAGLLCSLAVLIAHGLVDSVTWGLQIPSPLVWALFGLAMAGEGLTMDDGRRTMTD
jgi:putative inorganic carbon (HCO3(-)) transporter